MAYLPAGISVEELLGAAEDLQHMLPTPMASRPSEPSWRVLCIAGYCTAQSHCVTGISPHPCLPLPPVPHCSVSHRGRCGRRVHTA